MHSIASRLRKAMEIRGVSQTELVKRTGIGKSSISTYLSGDYEPKQKNTYKIAKALDVNEAWLLGYDVPMERNSGLANIDNAQSKKTLKEVIEESDRKRYATIFAYGGGSKTIEIGEKKDYYVLIKDDASGYERVEMTRSEFEKVKDILEIIRK